jgi:hypothetical protein
MRILVQLLKGAAASSTCVYTYIDVVQWIDIIDTAPEAKRFSGSNISSSAMKQNRIVSMP